MTPELIGIIGTFVTGVVNLLVSVYAMTMAGSCRSRCCMGEGCGCCDMAHEEKDDKLDVDMSLPVSRRATISSDPEDPIPLAI